MNEEEMIKKLADPILKQLQELEEQYGTENMAQIPQVKFMTSGPIDEPILIGDIELTQELLEKVEQYVQDELEMMHKPTVFH